jgi:hypothetical protein
MTTGLALRMQVELAALMRERGVSIASHPVALADPVDHDVELHGLAATVDVDLTHQKFRGWAFENLCILLKSYPLPPLLYKHQDSVVAGTITRLDYDDHGSLKIAAEVSHPMARRCNAFSVGATILKYEIVDNGGQDFHALISSARIDEISLTDRPANPNALVRSRYPTGPMKAYVASLHAHSDLFIKGIGVMQRQLEILQQAFTAPAPPPPPQRIHSAPQAPPQRIHSTPPRRATPFGALVSAIERNHNAAG